jgi:hypothetical protein
MVMNIMDMEDALCQILKKRLLHTNIAIKYCHVVCVTIDGVWIGQ